MRVLYLAPTYSHPQYRHYQSYRGCCEYERRRLFNPTKKFVIGNHTKLLHGNHQERQRAVVPVYLCMKVDGSIANEPKNSDQQISLKQMHLADLLPFMKRLFRLVKPFWTEEEKTKAWLWSLVTITLALATTLYAALLSFIQRFFWSALSAKDLTKFRRMMWIYLVAVIIGPPILVLFDWTKSRMSLAWRQFLTKLLLKKYLHNRQFYKLAFHPEIDNPDQRLAEDIRSFTERAVNLLCVIFVSAFDLVIFSVILFRIYPPLYWTLLVYSMFGTAVTVYFGRGLITLNSLQLSKEADFRVSLVRIREHAETIAFYRGEERERASLLALFKATLGNMIRLLKYQRNLSFFTTGYRYLINLLPSLIAAPIYFQGKIELGTISQTYFSFNHVLNDLSLIINEFFSLSAFSAVINRIEDFRIAMEESSSDIPDTQQETQSFIRTYTSSVPKLHVENLTLRIPNKTRILIRNLSFEVSPDQNLLITGESGVGKSSLMRAIAGLWQDGKGAIGLPSNTNMFLIPQRPYIIMGSILENVLYPSIPSSTIPEREIQRILEEVNLGHLVERLGDLNGTLDLSSILSLGEQQRLAFARLLISKPNFVFLDESTSALDEENERRMYNLLKSHQITFVSVGNRSTLIPFHEVVLKLFGDGSWKIDQNTRLQASSHSSIQL
eukprot:jgi/Galph1/748/GphlegSOOS_G5473.1